MKVHLAISVSNIQESIIEYNEMLGCPPDLIIDPEYALWRTDALNLSIRKTHEKPGVVRHVGFEMEDAGKFEIKKDRDGLVWEIFNKSHQAEEIEASWPGVGYIPK